MTPQKELSLHMNTQGLTNANINFHPALAPESVIYWSTFMKGSHKDCSGALFCLVFCSCLVIRSQTPVYSTVLWSFQTAKQLKIQALRSGSLNSKPNWLQLLPIFLTCHFFPPVQNWGQKYLHF